MCTQAATTVFKQVIILLCTLDLKVIVAVVTMIPRAEPRTKNPKSWNAEPLPYHLNHYETYLLRNYKRRCFRTWTLGVNPQHPRSHTLDPKKACMPPWIIPLISSFLPLPALYKPYIPQHISIRQRPFKGFD